MRIYTKTGDDGETGMIGGGRIAKDSLKIGVVGELDELNAAVGMCRCAAEGTELEAMCASVQQCLFAIGAEIATPAGSPISLQLIEASAVESLEASIDDQDDRLEDLHNFILPGGTEGAARFHLARAVCRRAERSLWALSREEDVRSEVKAFMNRLSDWLFVAARTMNNLSNVEDIKWTR